jgi:hypothetical protein
LAPSSREASSAPYPYTNDIGSWGLSVCPRLCGRPNIAGNFSSIGLAERVRNYLVQKANIRDKGEVQTTAVEPADLAMSIFQAVANPTSPDWPDDDDDSDEAEITVTSGRAS